MLNWLLRKRSPPAQPAGTPAAAPVAPPAAAPARELWSQRLEAARGDDAALLDVARAAPLLELKLAAVEGLAGEAALKQAEREFRSHDRRVHQRARQRLAAAVAQREARAQAETLLAGASAMASEVPLAANRLAALDRDWQALGEARLETAQRDAFAALRERLDAALRSQDEARRGVRWSATAAQALADLQRASAAGAAAAIEAAAAVARAHLDARPAGASAEEAAQALQVGLEAALAALAAAPPPPTPAAPPPPAPIRVDKPTRNDWLPRVDALLAQAEAALAEGRTAALHGHLEAADAALAELPQGTALPAPLRARLQSLHAERARLKGWQQWGGALAREALVDEAESLSRLTTAAQAEPPAARLNLKAHGDAVRKLRVRWKELDRSGAAASQPLWQRFDAALTLAHAPVAAQQAAIKAARADNLAAREALLATLGEAAGRTASQRETAAALDYFQRAWRKLGSIEHTVPAAAAGDLQQRLAATLSNVEAPLAEARAAAAREREALVARAEALGQGDGRDGVARLRELQAEWQQHARALPLARAVEATLWARFRQASDAVFARREAAIQARDAEAAAAVAAREARAAAAQAAESLRLVQWQAQCDALLERLALCEQRESGDAGTDAGASAQRWQAAGGAPARWQRALEQRWSSAGAGPLTAPALDRLLLRLEHALAIAPAAEQAQALRDLKLLAMKDALEGRARATGDPTEVDPVAWLALVLAQPGLVPAQKLRLHAVLQAVRGSPQRFSFAAAD